MGAGGAAKEEGRVRLVGGNIEVEELEKAGGGRGEFRWATNVGSIEGRGPEVMAGGEER